MIEINGQPNANADVVIYKFADGKITYDVAGEDTEVGTYTATTLTYGGIEMAITVDGDTITCTENDPELAPYITTPYYVFQACDAPSSSSSSSDTTSSSSGTSGEKSYVYSVTLAVEDISTAWGGSAEKPSFAFFLASQGALDGFADATVAQPQDSPVGMPSYQIKLDNNATFAILNEAGATGVYDSGAMVYYDGLAAEFDGEGNVTLYVDLEQVNVDQMYVLGKDIDGGEGGYAENIAADPSLAFDKDDVVPCVLALLPVDGNEDLFVAEFWNASLHLMNNEGTFPEDIDKPTLEAPKTLADINYIIGTVNGWNDQSSDPNLTEGVFIFDASDATTDVTHEFKYIVAGNGWSFQAGPTEETVADLDTKIPLTTSGNAPVVKFTAEAGKKYKITYYHDDTETYCMIEEAE
jgi:hypothetical protein